MQPATRNRGFTLIELMVTVSVLAILLTLAIPSFADLMRSNQVAASTNNLLASLNMARSEASKQGRPVSICAALDAGLLQCSNSANDWVNGWIVFTDAAGTAGAIDAGPTGDVIVGKSTGLPAQLQLSTDVAFVRFNASGARMNTPGAGAAVDMEFDLRHATCHGKNLRKVQVNRIGRVTMTKVDCP